MDSRSLAKNNGLQRFAFFYLQTPFRCNKIPVKEFLNKFRFCHVLKGRGFQPRPFKALNTKTGHEDLFRDSLRMNV
jgi:hypothetical protein